MLVLINDRMVHVAPQTAEFMMTYQDIVDFITTNYWHDSVKVFEVQPRISVFSLIVRIIWKTLLGYVELDNDLLKVSNEYKSKWEVFIQERVLSPPQALEQAIMFVERYYSELRIFGFILSPVSAVILIHRI